MDLGFWWLSSLGTSTTRNSTFHESPNTFNYWRVPYRMVFKQQMRMQRLSFADRATAMPEDEDEDGSEVDASNRECGSGDGTDSESLADGECDSEQ